ncbi:hypothetical protein [Bradyrhizobium sp. 150]|uniref:hypothetical protein n=1 Tax=Bradyrhizobium sp. 150 TaxID=2782625 RepID=UPI001FF7298B|nr:hypothetical protein [Bradyrhizobium sp. 150]MCK1671079.1 hypothetical protein [Bradyrhizobium sp. 150]
MVKTTRQQREALARVYSRKHPKPTKPEIRGDRLARIHTRAWLSGYRSFRRSIQPSFDRSGCVMVHWSGMWLGIETDGYTHS